MKLEARAMALAAGLLWGCAIFAVTVVHALWPGYGQAFLDGLASVYPGFRAGTGAQSVVVGTLYAFIDGFVAGGLFAWVYNAMVRPTR